MPKVLGSILPPTLLAKEQYDQGKVAQIDEGFE
jgi:hypothetical protein